MATTPPDDDGGGAQSTNSPSAGGSSSSGGSGEPQDVPVWLPLVAAFSGMLLLSYMMGSIDWGGTAGMLGTAGVVGSAIYFWSNHRPRIVAFLDPNQ